MITEVYVTVPTDDVSAAALVTAHQRSWPPDSFLAELPSGCLQALASSARIATFSLDDMLIEEGSSDADVFLLLSSYVKVTARIDRGGEALLAVRGGGDIVGELSALDGEPRSATVKACGRAQVITARLAGRAFWDIVGEDKTAARLLAVMGASKLRLANRRRLDITGASPVIRVARVLKELLVLHGRPFGSRAMISLDLTQVELGTLVGVTRPTAERALRKLRDDGLLDTGGRHFVVLDQQGLNAVAEGLPPSFDG